MKNRKDHCVRRFLITAILYTALLNSAIPVIGANCLNTSTGFIPLIDLGNDTYNGFSGGLYPFGSNSRPQTHELAGIQQSYQIRPRDAKGLIKAHGKIVFLSIGMSNATQEYSTFKAIADADPQRNPKVQIVDGAQSSMTADRISDLNSSQGQQFWQTVDQRLTQSGATAKQVQAVWLKEADGDPLTTFPEDALRLKSELKLIAQILKQRFRNLRAVYLTSRIYGGFSDQPVTRGEPVSYQTGFAVKWLIEDQINGAPELNYDGRLGPVSAPWLSWGPYLWADGTTTRSDGLFFVCSDFVNDGHHPAPGGARDKVALRLLDFLKTDSTAQRWFVKP